MRLFLSFVIAAALGCPAALAKPSQTPAETSFAVLYPFAGAQGQQAQASLDRLGAQIAQRGGFGRARGHFFARPKALRKALQKSERSVDAMLMPLASYLALKSEHPTWIASYEVSLVSPQQGQFFLVTDDPTRKSCEGASVATHHLDESPFVTKVVAGGDTSFDKLNWVQQRRPIQVLKTLLRGQSDCALIDQAQLDAAKGLPGGDAVKVLWSSKPLPSMVVVLQGQAKSWKKALGSLCRDSSRTSCQEVGLLGFKKLRVSRIRSLESLYRGKRGPKSKARRRHR